MEAIRLEFGTSTHTVGIDFRTGATLPTTSGDALPVPIPFAVENRAEADMDVSETAEQVLRAYGDALEQLADR